MALIVQDNTGAVAGANAYITVEEFKTYHTDRGNSFADFTDPQIEAAVIRATDYLDQRFSFVGKKRRGRDQTTEWPRTDAWDRDRRSINDIPVEVREACAEYAIRALSQVLNPDPERDATGRPIHSKAQAVGPISESVTYAYGGAFTMPAYPAADRKLVKAGLVRSGGNLVRG